MSRLYLKSTKEIRYWAEKTELLTKLHDRSISLEAEGMTKLDIEKLLIREIESKSLAVDTSDLNIDKSNVLKLKKRRL